MFGVKYEKNKNADQCIDPYVLRWNDWGSVSELFDCY